MAASSQDLTSLRADIKRQQEIAQEVSEEAERLEILLKEPIIPPELKPKLEISEAIYQTSRYWKAGARG